MGNKPLRHEERNLILIPARSGSTRVINKNIRDLGGKSLVTHTIESSLDSTSGRVVVSTNSEEISAIARLSGAEVPFLRPDELSTAEASSLSVIYHALDWFRDNEQWVPDLVMFRPPTNPFLPANTMRKMVEMINKNPDVNSIVTITEASTHPFKIIHEQPDGRLKNGVITIEGKTINDIERSQDWPEVWEGCPACRITRTSYFIQDRNGHSHKTYDVDNFIGFKISNEEACDIDNPLDFLIAESIYQSYKEKKE